MKSFLLISFILSMVFITLFTYNNKELIFSVFAKEKFDEDSRDWSRDKVKRYIEKKWLRHPKEAKKAIAVFTAESGLNCKSENRKYGDIGVAQINKMHWDRFGGKDKLKSCKRNIDAAFTLYKEWGDSFKPWIAYRNGSYKQFMD